MFFLFASTGAIIELLDFGVAGNITKYFAFSSNLDKTHSNLVWNATNLLNFSKLYYRWLTGIAFIVIVLGFSIYLYYFLFAHQIYRYWHYESTWLLYSISTLIGIYYMYLGPLLIGYGFIDKVNKVSLVSRVVGLIIQVLLIIGGVGLLSIAFGALVSTFLERLMLIAETKRLQIKLNQRLSKYKFRFVFSKIWKINYKLGLLSLAWLLLSKLNTFVAGFAIKDIVLLTEYLFTFQVINIILAFAHVPISNNWGDISAIFIKDQREAMKMFLVLNKKSLYLMLGGCIGMVVMGNYILHAVHFKHQLLPFKYLIIIALTYLLEKQLINHSTMISVRDEVPMLKSYLVTSTVVFLLLLLCSFMLNWGLWAIILPQLIGQLSFNYWYWVRYNLSKSNVKITSYCRGLLPC